MRFTVGITGGIGSGKSAVTDRLQSYGIAVVDADVVGDDQQNVVVLREGGAAGEKQEEERAHGPLTLTLASP